MNKYGPKAQKKIEETMEEYKEGKLTDGHGNKVKSRDQAVAIGVSKAREAGYKVPSKN